MVDCQPHSIQYQLKSVGTLAVYIYVKNITHGSFLFILFTCLAIDCFKKGYYMCMKTDASSEWVTELTHLQQRLAHDI